MVLDTEGGGMTKKEADQKAIEIFREWGRKADEIQAHAIKNGEWVPGLDSDRHLFAELDCEMKKRLKELVDMIDE